MQEKRNKASHYLCSHTSQGLLCKIKSSFIVLLVVYISHFDAVVVKLFLKSQHTKCVFQQRDQIEGEVEATRGSSKAVD